MTIGPGEPRPATIGCLVHSADFQRLLGTRPWSRSAHFAVHHVPASPGTSVRAGKRAAVSELSTGAVDKPSETVDDLRGRYWLGAVLPKRLARRSVTRNLLRRQIRAALHRHAGHLPGGLWLVRLRAGFDRREFLSAASDHLRVIARAELEQALAVVRPPMVS